MRRLLYLFLAAATCGMLAACGYKGPLVRPAAAPAAASTAATPATPSTTPASARSD